MQPRLESFRITQVRKLAPRGDEGGLHRVLGEADVAQDPIRDRQAPIAGHLRQGTEGLTVPMSRAVDERFEHEAPPHGTSL